MKRFLLIAVGIGLLAAVGIAARLDRAVGPWLRPLVFPAGDSGEYLHILQAWWDHGTPDVRPEDSERLAALARSRGLDDAFVPLTAEVYFRPTDTGLRFGYHFWLYPLCALPAKAVLWAAGRNELAAFLVTNGLLFVLAMAVVLLDRSRPLSKRLLLAGLAGVGPVLWYVRWPHPEVFTWALVLISLSLLGRGRYVTAALCAALGATQNPPVTLLAGVIVLLSLRERRPWLTVATAAAAAVAITPNVFCMIFYGRPSLIVAQFSSPAYISAARTWSLLTDLNQGLLPYLPGLFLLALAALAQVIWKRSLPGLAVAAALAGMIVAVQLTPNWNCGEALMMRYLVWMVPPLAWLVVEYLPATRLVHGLAAGAVVLHAGILTQHDGSMVFLEQTRLASYVLSRWPRLYDPLPEVFAERQLGFDNVCESNRLADFLPVAFRAADGQATKVLVDDQSLPCLSAAFETSPEYLDHVTRKLGDRRGLFYVTPPRYALHCRREILGEELTSGKVRVELLQVPSRVTTPRATLEVRITNHSDGVCWTQGARDRRPLHVSYHLLQDGKMLRLDGERSRLPGSLLGPGESRQAAVVVTLPTLPGTYVLEIRPVVEMVGWGSDARRVGVVVSHNEGGYAAELKTIDPVRRVAFGVSLNGKTALHRFQERLDLSRLREHVRRYPNPPWVADDADVAGVAFRDHLLQVSLGRLEADKAGVEGVGAGVHQTELLVLRDAIADPLAQRVDAGEDALGADGVEEIEGRLQADHHRQVGRAEVREAVGLLLVVAPPGRRGVDPEFFEQRVADVQDAGALGGAEPFVRAGGVEVAAEVVQVQRDLADAVRAVDVGKRPVFAGELANLLRR